MKHSKVLLNRLRASVGEKSGCSPLYLKVLKSDLARLLSQYMAFEGLELGIAASNSGYDMTINLKATDFYELGRGVE